MFRNLQSKEGYIFCFWDRVAFFPGNMSIKAIVLSPMMVDFSSDPMIDPSSPFLLLVMNIFDDCCLYGIRKSLIAILRKDLRTFATAKSGFFSVISSTPVI
jgi:hypothetical protein